MKIPYSNFGICARTLKRETIWKKDAYLLKEKKMEIKSIEPETLNIKEGNHMTFQR